MKSVKELMKMSIAELNEESHKHWIYVKRVDAVITLKPIEEVKG